MRQAQACLRVKAVSAADDNLIPNKGAPSTTSNSAKYIQKSVASGRWKQQTCFTALLLPQPGY